MPAASPLEAIETSVAAELVTVPGLLAVTVAPFADMFPVDPEFGAISLNRTTLPDKYPGAVVSLNDDDITVAIEDRTLGPRTVFNTYRAPVYIAVYAQSDGTTEPAARWKAWEIAHAVIAQLVEFRPTGAPEPWKIEADELMEPGNITPVVIDSTTYAVIVRFYAKYYIVSP